MIVDDHHERSHLVKVRVNGCSKPGSKSVQIADVSASGLSFFPIAVSTTKIMLLHRPRLSWTFKHP